MTDIEQPVTYPTYTGRLELTWTNKHLNLLAHEDQTYEWVDSADYRVSEVHLLHDVAKVGETATYSLPNGRALSVEILEAVPYGGI